MRNGILKIEKENKNTDHINKKIDLIAIKAVYKN